MLHVVYIFSCTCLCIHFVQVPLGIILKNEQKHDDMVEILQHLHQHVPTVNTTKTVNVPGYSLMYIPHDHFHQPAFGELTVFVRTHVHLQYAQSYTCYLACVDGEEEKTVQTETKSRDGFGWPCKRTSSSRYRYIVLLQNVHIDVKIIYVTLYIANV